MKPTKAEKSPLKWTTGNAKLIKTGGKGEYHIVGFGIPADTDFEFQGRKLNTCPGASACRAVCYAKQGSYTWNVVKNARKANLENSVKPAFVQWAISDLSRMRKVNTVRIHDSGDFYSQQYFDAWCQIARALPNLTFYAYTKSLHLDLTQAPKNLRITQSLGGLHDKRLNLTRPHSRIFATHADRKRAGYVDGNDSDIPAIEGEKNIGLVYHGTRNLTEAQARFFK